MDLVCSVREATRRHELYQHFVIAIIMNSKYREVPRLPKHHLQQNNPRIHGDRKASVLPAQSQGVSTRALAQREAEIIKQLENTYKKPSLCALFGVGALFCGVLFDAAAWGTTGWGYGHNGESYTHVGLWQICNTSFQPKGEGVEPEGGESEDAGSGVAKEMSETTAPGEATITRCVFPTTLSQDWIHKALVMEIMAGFCAIGILVCLVVFLVSLKVHTSCLQARTMTITMIPLALLAALMNFIGVLTISLNLATISCHPSYSVALDALGVLGFTVGGTCSLMDIQGTLKQKPPDEDQPSLRGHYSEAVSVFSNS